MWLPTAINIALAVFTAVAVALAIVARERTRTLRHVQTPALYASIRVPGALARTPARAHALALACGPHWRRHHCNHDVHPRNPRRTNSLALAKPPHRNCCYCRQHGPHTHGHALPNMPVSDTLLTHNRLRRRRRRRIRNHRALCNGRKLVHKRRRRAKAPTDASNHGQMRRTH